MFELSALENRDLGEGLGLAFLLVFEIVALAVMLVLVLISLIPFLAAIKREKSGLRCGGICLFIYEAVTLFLSIIALVVLVVMI